MVAEILLWDINDFLGTFNFCGDETVYISFGAPGGVECSYTLALDLISNSIETGSTKSKLYELHLTSEETLQSRCNFVTKNYNTEISSIVQDIHQNYLMSSKSLQIEPTQGQQNITIPGYEGFKGIDMVRRRAVSAQNQSSTYVYFENYLGYYFKTIEGMLQQSPIKTFTHVDSVGSSIYNQTENNILAYTVPQIASSIDRISMGSLKQRISTYNIRTRKYTYNDVEPPPSNYNSPAFTSKYGQNYGNHSFIPVDTANRPFTGIDSMTPPQLGFVGSLMQNQVNLKVYGDALVKAGDTVNLLIPEYMNVTGPVGLDPQISGTFLVSRICRTIGTSQETPRYTDAVECLNGVLATSAS